MLSFAIHKHLNSCFPHNVLEMMSLFANWNTAGTSLVSLSEDLNFRSIHCANCTVMSTGSLIFSFVLFIALCWVLLVFGLCVVIAFTAIHRRAQVKVMVELATAPGRGGRRSHDSLFVCGALTTRWRACSNAIGRLSRTSLHKMLVSPLLVRVTSYMHFVVP